MKHSSRVTLFAIAASATVNASAQEPIGPQFQVSVYTQGQQFYPSVASGSDGSYFVVWWSEGQEGDPADIYGRRIAASGVPLGPEFRINVYRVGWQQFHSVASDPQGNFVIVWTSFGDQDGDEAGVYGRRFDSAGTPQGPEFRVNMYTIGNQLGPRVAFDASGNFVVVWQSTNHEGRIHDDGLDYDLFGRRYAANGTPRSAEFRINTTVEDNQVEPVVCSDPTSRFTVAWTSVLQAGDFYGVWARRYGASGAAISPELHVSADSAPDGFQYLPSIACDLSGGFLLVWQGDDAGYTDIFGRRYSAAGVPEGPEFRINTFTDDLQLAPSVVKLPSGFLVLWQTQKQVSTTEGIFGRRLDDRGDPVGDEFPVHTVESPYHLAPVGAADADGNYLVAWSDYLPTGTREHDVFGRLYQHSYDFGDAPDPLYPTLRAHDGARHIQPGPLEPSALHLGALVDSEVDASSNPAQSLDDDGVVFPSSPRAAAASSVDIESSASGFLDGWIDFNGDGDWNDGKERVFASRALGAGTNSFPFQVPPSAKPGATAARFRVSSAGGLSPTGFAADGEVEDYSVLIEPMSMSVADASIVEGNAGGRSAAFYVSLAAASPRTVSVDYLTEGGTATAPTDYATKSGTLVFSPGVTRLAAMIAIVGDTVVEDDESFHLRLSNPQNATLTRADALGTISNDDHSGSFRFRAANYVVGESAPSVTITVERTGGSASGASVAYQTSDGSAVEGSDYSAASGVLAFGAGVVSRTFSVPLIPDTALEANEAVLLQLHDPVGTGASLSQPSTAVLTIRDNDPAQTLRFGAPKYSATEGAAMATVTVVRENGTSGTVTANYAAADETATHPSDYGATSGTLTFGPGITARSFTVPIVNDGAVEGEETVTLSLSNTVGASLGTPSVATLAIADNDVEQTVQFSSASYSRNEANGSATIVVKRAGGTGGTVSVEYATADATATQPGDYRDASGTLTFGPGATTMSFLVPLVNDNHTEGSETVSLSLTSPTGAVLGARSTALLTILDSEPTFKFSAASYVVSEQGSKLSLTVLRTGSTALAASVSYGTSDGTATAGADYVAASGTLAFGPGVSSRSFPLTILADTVDEPNETIQLALSAASGAGLGTPSGAMVTVSDNDLSGTARFSAESYSAGEASGSAFITVTRSGGTSGAATIDYTTSDGSATDGEDYTATSGTLTFGFGESSRTFTVLIDADGSPETNETVTLTLSNAGGGLTLGSPFTAVLWLVEPP